MSDTIKKIIIKSPNVAKPLGPYSPAVLVDRTLYVSGVLGMDKNSKLVQGIEAQTRQALDNMKHVLAAGGASLETVVKCTVLLRDFKDFPIFNKIYGEYFPENQPARITYQVTLPPNAEIEIDAIAISGNVEVVPSRL